MDKKTMIEKIDNIFNFFYDAKNHGHQGNNWWHPTANYIAYNIKLSNWITSDDIIKKLTPTQKEYYVDIEETVNYLFWDYVINNELECLKDDIKELSSDILDIRKAGRSGGWLEVEYNNDIDNDYIEEYNTKELEEVLQRAEELQALEIKVRNLIEARLKGVHEYIETSLTDDIYNELHNDEEIKGIYQARAKELNNKIKSI